MRKVSSRKTTWLWGLRYVCNRVTLYDIQICIGRVYLGKDIKTEREVALKLEVAEDSSLKLLHEYNVYKAISGLPGIPRAYWCGREGPYYVLILDRLGHTLEAIARTSMLNTSAIFTYAMEMVFLFIIIYLSMLIFFQAFNP